ncbi:MAG: HDOD domain-containing protein [Armatimonadetes bacterium]|nr:HDOD domain-containing protein [Armatimonadota bacterium]
MNENSRQSAIQATIDKAMGDLPPLPTLVTKVLQITGNTNGNAVDLEQYLSMDQALSSKMLRVANSPYFGISGKVSNIRDTIVILGFTQIRNLVLSVGASGMFTTENAKSQPVQMQLWKHSMAMAAAVQAICKAKGLPSKDHESTFVAAMISNVGALFLLKHLTLPYLQMWERFSAEGSQNLHVFESEVFGMSHAEIGRQLATQWKLPDDLIGMLGQHEGPISDAEDRALMAVHLADRFASTILAGKEDKGVVIGVDPVAWKWFDPQTEQVELIKAEAKLKIDDSAELLSSLAA